MFGISASRLLVAGAMCACLAVGGCAAYPDAAAPGGYVAATPYGAGPYYGAVGGGAGVVRGGAPLGSRGGSRGSWGVSGGHGGGHVGGHR